MAVSSIVTFRFTPQSASPLYGKGLADTISKALNTKNIRNPGAENREDWGWDILCTFKGFKLEVICGNVIGEESEWLITTHTHISLLKKLSAQIKQDANSVHSDLITTIYNVLCEAGVSEMKWYEQKDFDEIKLERFQDKPLLE